MYKNAIFIAFLTIRNFLSNTELKNKFCFCWLSSSCLAAILVLRYFDVSADFCNPSSGYFELLDLVL